MIRMGYCLSCIFCSFTWYYMRTGAFETFQVPLVTVVCYHLLAFMRTVQQAGKRRWLHLIAATLATGVLGLMKVSFLSMYGAIWLLASVAGAHGQSPLTLIFNNLRQHWRGYLLSVVIPTGLCFSLVGWVNHMRYGGALNTGYGQWDQGAAVLVSSRYFWNNLGAYLWFGHDANVFIYFPPAILGALGLLPLFRRSRIDAIAFITLSIFFALPLLFARSLGKVCIGPRYMLALLPVAAVPAVLAWEHMTATRGRIGCWVSRGLRLTCMCVLLCSLCLQLGMNSPQFNACASMCASVRQTVSHLGEEKRMTRDQAMGYESRLSRYLRRHPGMLSWDMICYVENQRPFEPIIIIEDMLRQSLPEDRQREALQHFRQQFDAHMRAIAKPNYRFFE